MGKDDQTGSSKCYIQVQGHGKKVVSEILLKCSCVERKGECACVCERERERACVGDGELKESVRVSAVM